MLMLRVENNKGETIYAVNSGTQELMTPELANWPTPAPIKWFKAVEAEAQGVIIPPGAPTRTVQITVPVEIPSEEPDGQSTFEDQSFDVLEYAVPDYTVHVEDTAAADAEAAELQQAEGDQIRGHRILAKIVTRNRKKFGLTQEQVVQLTQTYGTIQNLLVSGSLPTAKGIVSSLTPDEVVFTAEDKTAILEFFVDEGIT